MNHSYPVMLDLSGRTCLVVGGGSVAERKIASLLEAGALITVVAPRFTPRIAGWMERGLITGHKRRYEASDGENMQLIFAAADRKEVNVIVREDARRRGQWINVADDPGQSDFTVPATIHRGRLALAVSTGGASPALAGRIADQLRMQFGPEYVVMLDFIYELRQYILQHIPQSETRKEMLMLVAEEDWIRHMRSETFDRSLQRWVGRLEERVRRKRRRSNEEAHHRRRDEKK